MEPFRQLTGIAAPLPIANIDTDLILSARFLKTVSRAGLGVGLLHAARFDEKDHERPGFILNRAPWRSASILVALDNFGCGSSREHAPWALLDFGIRCIIAPSFADIFHGNCFKNGILPIRLERVHIDTLLTLTANPETAELHVDLETQKISRAGLLIHFNVEPQLQARLLGGVDDIANTLRFAEAVSEHENSTRIAAPWLAESRIEAVALGPSQLPIPE